MQTEPIKKITVLRGHIRSGDWRAAFALAASFPRLGNERQAILDAHEAMVRPAFLLQLRKQPEQLIAIGKVALLSKYGV